MEKGFFHPDRGYWQTMSAPSDKTLAGYPDGTTEVPIKPSGLHTWDGGQWVAPTSEEADAAARAEFAVLVKLEAERRILAIMPVHVQRNTLAKGMEMTMAHGADTALWPQEEQDRAAAALVAWSQIEAIRAKSNEIEVMDPMPDDASADELWV